MAPRDLTQEEPGHVGRGVPEWIGATPDSPIPKTVKLRVFRDHGGICHIALRKIRPGEPWDAEHVKALADGGENRETNLRPALRDKHREKTAAENSRRAAADRKACANLGIKTAGKGWNTRLRRKMDGTVEERR